MVRLTALNSIVTLSIVFLLFTLNISQATTYYVDQNHPSASDANPGTEDLPWLTIQHAAETIVAGDTVLIRNGVYNEPVSTVRSGNSTDGHIVFSAYPGETPVIDGTGVIISNDGFVVTHSYIKLIGLEIRDWYVGIWMDNAGYVEISDCEVHHSAFGIGAINGTHDFVLNQVEIHHFFGYGFDASPSGGADCYNGTFNDCVAHTGEPGQNVDGFALGHGTQHDFVFNRCKAYDVYDGFDISARDTTLNSCLSHDNVSTNYKLWQDNIKLVNCIGYNLGAYGNVALAWTPERPPDTTTLINCTFFNASSYNIYVENSADTLKMYNCIIAGGDNIGLCFETNGVGNYQGDYNIFHNDNPGRAIVAFGFAEFSLEQIEDGDWTAYSGQDAHSLVVYSDTDLFVDPANFDLHILETSLAVDNGTSDGAPLEDYEGKPRPQGGGYDIGAYEYGEPGLDPRISVTPVSYDFGSVNIERASAPQIFTISSIGKLDLNIFSNLQFPYRSERRLDGGFRLIGVANRKAIFQRKPLMAVCFEALKLPIEGKLLEGYNICTSQLFKKELSYENEVSTLSYHETEI